MEISNKIGARSVANNDSSIDVECVQEKPDRYATAPPWKLTWWAFKSHKLALFSLWFIAILYVIAIFVEVFAPNSPYATDSRAVFHPPQAIKFLDRDEDGLRFAPHVIAQSAVRDPITMRRTFTPDPDDKVYLSLFGRGDPYRLWGFIPMDRHFITTQDLDRKVYFLGADRLGRDVLSRMIYGIRISLTIGLFGVMISLVLGVVLGALSGYCGGWVDTVIQRVVEFMLSVPTIPIYLGLAALIPTDVPTIYTFAAIVLILSLIGWTELARIVRGRFLALRKEDFVMAAKLDGASHGRLIFRHMLPAMTSQIIATVSLAIPMMIVVETSLSFLGLGLQTPAISWGLLLQEAQNVRSLSEAPWLLSPGALVVVAVLAFNFLGDGLRDAADPYSELKI